MCLPADQGRRNFKWSCGRTTGTEPVVCTISRKMAARARAARPARAVAQYHESRERCSSLLAYELLCNHQQECLRKAPRRQEHPHRLAEVVVRSQIRFWNFITEQSPLSKQRPQAHSACGWFVLQTNEFEAHQSSISPDNTSTVVRFRLANATHGYAEVVFPTLSVRTSRRTEVGISLTRLTQEPTLWASGRLEQLAT